jgi:uncharacterized protein (UPF0332 family)
LDTKRRIKKYSNQCIHYLQNAQHFIEAGDIGKASEFLWGSLAQALKALAASKDIQLRSHRQIRDYVMEVARVLEDESIRHAFDYAQSLHSNFYECDLSMEDVAMAAEDVKAAVAKILRFLPEQN